MFLIDLEKSKILPILFKYKYLVCKLPQLEVHCNILRLP